MSRGVIEKKSKESGESASAESAPSQATPPEPQERYFPERMNRTPEEREASIQADYLKTLSTPELVEALGVQALTKIATILAKDYYPITVDITKNLGASRIWHALGLSRSMRLGNLQLKTMERFARYRAKVDPHPYIFEDWDKMATMLAEVQELRQQFLGEEHQKTILQAGRI